jgi:AraC-like DNA-binding protein
MIEITNVTHYRYTYPSERKGFSECRHADHVVALHLRAQGQYIVGKEVLNVKTPFLGLLAAGELDSNGLVGPFEGYWCLFKGDIVKSVPGHLKVALAYGDVSLQRPHHNHLDSAKACEILRVFQALYDGWRRPDLTARLRSVSLLHELLAFWSESPNSSGQVNPAHLFRDLIEQYATNADVSLTDLAARVDLCSDHLAMLFQKEFGIPPVEYRSRVRLSLASELLVSSTKPVREIARRCGFSDANYFARAFKSSYKKSPVEYRIQNRMTES